jgi:hypothetical protein
VRARHLSGLALACACGRIGFSAALRGDGGSADAVVDGAADASPDASPDAAPPDGASGICGGSRVLSDDFLSSMPSLVWSVTPGSDITTTQGSGELQFAFGSSAPGSAYTTYQEMGVHDFRGGCMVVRQDAAPASATSVYMYSSVNFNTSGVGTYVDGGELQAIYFTTSVSASIVTQAAFDPVAHRYVRLSEDAGTFTWETSPDGVTYTMFTTSSGTGFDASQMFVVLGAAVGATATMEATTVDYGPVTFYGP